MVMDVFVGRDRRRAVGDALRNAIQSLLQLITFFQRKHAGVAQCQGPRLRQSNVVRPETEVRYRSIG